jgi:hypothetical protein
MQTEPAYRIRNWAEYNKALIQRGSIIIWIFFPLSGASFSFAFVKASRYFESS